MTRRLDSTQHMACTENTLNMALAISRGESGDRIVNMALGVAYMAADQFGSLSELLDWLTTLHDETRQRIALTAAQVAVARWDMDGTDGTVRAAEHVDWLVWISEDEFRVAAVAARVAVDAMRTQAVTP
jgi:hypothetical protein